MNKLFSLLSMLTNSFLLVMMSQVNALEVKDGHAYSCVCKSKGKTCDSLENLNITFQNKAQIQVDVGNKDWEFNETFDAKPSSKPVPSKYKDAYTRYIITSNRESLPGPYEKGDLLVKSNMSNGGTRIGGIKKIIYTGSVIVIDQKNTVKIHFGCTRN